MFENTFFSADKAKVMMAIMMAIQEVVDGGHELLSGPLYASVMSELTLNEFNFVLDTLKDAGSIKVVNHVISKA